MLLTVTIGTPKYLCVQDETTQKPTLGENRPQKN